MGGVLEAVYATTLLCPVSHCYFETGDHDVPWMSNIALASLQLHLIYLPTSSQCQQTASGDVGIPPVRYAQLNIVLRLQTQGMTCPSQQRLSLADNPVLPAIKVDRDDARNGRLCGDKGCDWGGGGNLLVKERNANRHTSEGLEEGQSR